MSIQAPLEDHLSESQLVEWLRKAIGIGPSSRTVARWRSQGMPYLVLVGKCVYPSIEVRQWLEGMGRGAAQHSPSNVSQDAHNSLVYGAQVLRPARRRGRPCK